MPLLPDLQALLDPLAAGGASYAVNEAQPPVYPYIVWQRVVSVANVALGGPSDVQNTRVQIDIYARTIAEAYSIETALEAAMQAWATPNVPLDSQDQYDEAVRAHRIIKDYSVWSTG